MALSRAADRNHPNLWVRQPAPWLQASQRCHEAYRLIHKGGIDLSSRRRPRDDPRPTHGAAGSLPGAGAQRRLSAAELLPALDLVLAGRHQGRVPRARQHRVGIRQDGAKPELRDAAALRRVAENLRQAVPPPGLHPLQRLPARPLHLPVLRRARGLDLRSSCIPRSKGGQRPGKTSSPPARRAICARAIAWRATST